MRVCAANVFALNEPDREPAYRAPNDRVLEWAAEVPDRLFPFVRLSLDEDPLGEAVRCLDRGARGIKLHPRAQAFRVNDPQLEAVFALADERRLPVLIHAGRGLPPGMPLELGHVAERHPGASLILAHAAIVAQAGIGELARSVENIFFDSSTWSPFDLLNLLSLVPPEQILWASDIPYGEPLAALNLFVRAARESGAGDDTPARDAARHRARAARRHAGRRRRSAPLGDAGVPHLVRARASHASIWRPRRRCSGWACPSTSDSWASPRRLCTRRGWTSRPSSCAARRRLGRVGGDGRAGRAARPGRPWPRLPAAQRRPRPDTVLAMSEVTLS